MLTVGFALQAPQTLDPGKTAQNYEWLEQLAYEPLIVRYSDGSLAPGLATSWAYTGTGNTTFVLHLRPGVKFSDGSALTARGNCAACTPEHASDSTHRPAPSFSARRTTPATRTPPGQPLFRMRHGWDLVCTRISTRSTAEARERAIHGQFLACGVIR